MKNAFVKASLAIGLIIGSLAPAFAAPPALYRLTATIPLGGAIKWDYLHFDSASHRLFISHGDEVTIFDTAASKVAGKISGLHGSHGIAIDHKAGLGFADSSGTHSINVFDLNTLQTLRVIPALEDADGMVYDPVSDQVYVVGGDAQAMLAIDPQTGKLNKSITLDGKPEFLVSDDAGSVYVNISDKNQIVRVDTKTNAVIARWSIAPCDRAAGLAIDPQARRLFSTCENSVMMIVDADTGKIIGQQPIGKGTDSAAFDPQRNLAFSANRDGTLSIIQENGPDNFSSEPSIKTEPGARTMAVDPVSGKIYLVTAKVGSEGPPKHPGFPPTYAFVPGSFKLLILSPAAIKSSSRGTNTNN